MGRSKKQQNREVKPSKFKTTLCQFYIKGEECPFGEKCAFAHGDQELRDETENDTDRHTPNNSGGTEGGDASPATSSLPSMVRVPPSVPNEALIIAKPIGSWSVPSSANELWALGTPQPLSAASSFSGRAPPEYDYFADRGGLLFLPNLNDGEGNVH